VRWCRPERWLGVGRRTVELCIPPFARKKRRTGHPEIFGSV
jgi:hypothetical protein